MPFCHEGIFMRNNIYFQLGGVVIPHDENCYLDKTGTYTHFDRFDYPSVGQVSIVYESIFMNKTV